MVSHCVHSVTLECTPILPDKPAPSLYRTIRDHNECRHGYKMRWKRDNRDLGALTVGMLCMVVTRIENTKNERAGDGTKAVAI